MTVGLLPSAVVLREVGLRDGLQGVGVQLQTAVKCDWILLAHVAGVRAVEVGAFGSREQFPQMTDTADVVSFAKCEPEISVSVLVYDLQGAHQAIAAEVDLIGVPIAASEAYSRARVGKTPNEMLAELRRVCAARDAAGSAIRIEAEIGTAFGCALQGAVAPAQVIDLVRAALDAGADFVGLGDTFGFADPDYVRRVFAEAIRVAGAERLSGHFHDTKGAGLANVVAVLELGVGRFDASLGGIGGCAFLPGASGNVSIEAIVSALARRGVDTGVELGRLLELRGFLGDKFGPEALRAALRSARPH